MICVRKISSEMENNSVSKPMTKLVIFIELFSKLSKELFFAHFDKHIIVLSLYTFLHSC